MARNTQKEYVKTELLEQGIPLATIEDAMKKTESIDLDVLLQYIDERRFKKEQEIESREEREKRRKIAELEEKKRRMKQDIIYKKQILDKIAADREEALKERKRELEAMNEETVSEKSVKILPKANECDIQVFDLETGRNYNFVLDKNLSIMDLFQEIEKESGLKDFEVLEGDLLIEDDRRTLDEHGFFPYATLTVKLPE
ncbi:hypothetical protein M153_10711000278 [Pseudoloma neurophilia]|uniref:Uncharacterized protein n=1 Tax=Pseudoloma neurophilia TaxID=146866 RepID=A0A0R0LRP2_9MICR|nr:hypothetical protein M153_10711000278 [Pseudoloma neurophilia]